MIAPARRQLLRGRRVMPGLYVVNETYVVERQPSGWRWRYEADASRGGEWRASRAEAMADLRAHETARRDAQWAAVELHRAARNLPAGT